MAAGGTARLTALRAPDRGSGRLSRIGLLTAAPLLLASGAHLVGGGTLPLVGVVLGVAVLALVSAAVSGRRCRFPLVLGLLAVEQAVLHLLLTAAAASAMCVPSGTMPAGHAGHLGAAGLGATPGAALQSCAQEHAMTPGWPMIAAHVTATLLLAWLLARGEAWWWRTVAELVRIVSARPTRRRPRPTAVAARSSHAAARLVLAGASPRGPPLFS